MPIQILPREEGLGETIGTGIGSGIGNTLQQLASMKMQQFAQRQQMALQEEANKRAMAQKHDLFEQTLGPGWGKLAYMPEKMGLMAIQGGWNPGMQQQPGAQQSGGLPQNMEVLNNQQPGAQGGMSALQGPGATNDLGKAIGQGAYNTPAMIQARKLQENQQKFTEEQNKLNRAAKAKTQDIAAKNQSEQQKMDFTKKIEPWLKNEDVVSGQINELGGIADQALDMLEEMGPNGYAGTVGRFIADKSGGWLYPSMKEFYNKTGELALAKTAALKGQPTNFKIKLVQSIKPGLSSNYKQNIRQLRRYKDVQEARSNRQAFRDNLQENGQFPINIESVMSEYDNAMNKPEKHKKFLEKYPQAKEDAYFLSRAYEEKKMKEEDEKYSKKDATPGKAAAPAIKVGAKLDKLPPASDYPGMEGLWNGKKVKSDGISWKGA